MLEKRPKWIAAIPAEAYFEAARTPPHGLGKDPQFLELQLEMRSLVPVPGDTWVHDIEVLIEPGDDRHQGQRRHAHPEWTAIFYVQTAGVPTFVVEDHQTWKIEPEPGDILIIPPNVDHWVDKHGGNEPRLSFAMLVQVPGQGSKYHRV